MTTVSAVAETRPAPASAGDLLSRSFLALLGAQFLTSLNDNMFRWWLVPIGKDLAGRDSESAAVAAGIALSVLPFMVFAAHAGYLADRFSKRNVFVSCRVAELAIVSLGVVAVLVGSLPLIFVMLALMSIQAALGGPSKYGSIPELVAPAKIAAANGLMGMVTVVGIVAGSLGGNVLADLTTLEDSGVLPGQHRWWIAAAALVGVALSGLMVSRRIRVLRPADPLRTFPVNPFGRTLHDLRELVARMPLLQAALGIAFFWSFGVLAQAGIDLFADRELLLGRTYTGILLGLLTLGVGCGSLIAGFWSGGRIELGVLPLGAAGIAAGFFFLGAAPDAVGAARWAAYGWSCLWLFALGVAAGLFNVPLQAFLQDRSPPQSRGAIWAANNFLSCGGMLTASGLFWLMGQRLHLPARQIFLISMVAALLLAVYVTWVCALDLLRVVARFLITGVRRVRLIGWDNVPSDGGAVLVANRLGTLEGVLLYLTAPRPIRMVASVGSMRGFAVRWLARRAGVIPLDPGPRSMVGAARMVRRALRDGHPVCVPSLEALGSPPAARSVVDELARIVAAVAAPVVPVYLDASRSHRSSLGGRHAAGRRTGRRFRAVAIRFGEPIQGSPEPRHIRAAMAELEGQAMHDRPTDGMILPRRFLRMCRRTRFRAKIADSTKAELTGSAMLMRALILRRLLRREVLADDEQYVGLLLPPAVATVVANAALALDRRVAVNLNYTLSSPVLNACISQCGIRHVLTSRRMMDRLDLDIQAEVVYLEDFRSKVRLTDKVVAGAQAWLTPVFLLERRLGLTRVSPDDVLTVIFTSGSTGDPKGVVLSHYNIGSNMDAFNEIIRLAKDDVMIGILPLFHSFGYTTTMWTALTLDPKVVYHYTPLEAKQVGELARRHGGTILIATPTFLRSYVRRCRPEDFLSMDVVITGAERLPKELADAFESKFGVRPVEGYGTTELSPVVSVNVPPSRALRSSHSGCREGTVGKPVPGQAAKVVDLDTGEELGPGKSGMLMIKGPNVMQGYLHRPDLTAEAIRDGWYVTGDIAQIDEDGFVRITGRESRFSKLAGEMVPHLRIEEAIAESLGLDEEAGVQIVVTGVPDPRKGERLVVLHTKLNKSPGQICRDLAEAGLPPLWIPSPDSFCEVDAIPVLGTGKLNVRSMKQLALEKFGKRPAAAAEAAQHEAEPRAEG